MTKVPSEPTLSPEMRRFLDDTSRAESRVREYVDGLFDDLPEFATEAEAEAGTSETVMMNPLQTKNAIFALNPFSNDFIHVTYEVSAGTEGGSITGSTWNTRPLNTVRTNRIDGASLSSNQVTLPAGRYWASASGCVFGAGSHIIRLYNVSGSADLIIGHGVRIEATDNAHNSYSTLNGEFSLASSSSVRLEHYSASSQATFGLGRRCDLGITEVYSDLRIWRLGD